MDLDKQLTKLWIDEESPYISHDDVKRLILEARLDELQKLKSAHSINIFDEYLEKYIAELRNQIKGSK